MLEVGDPLLGNLYNVATRGLILCWKFSFVTEYVQGLASMLPKE